MIAALFLTVALASPVDASPAPAPAQHSKVAPADEYFGRLKMSILGIANVIRDQGRRLEAHPEQMDAAFGSVAMAEDAVVDWEKKYPLDSWIPKTLLALERFYIHAGPRGRDGAIRCEAWLARDYPKSAFAPTGHQELADALSSTPVPAPGAITAPVPLPSASPASR